MISYNKHVIVSPLYFKSIRMDEEKECRVCREGEDNGENPLYAPCLCSGSILYCHEECLVEWLNRSGNDFCELCKTKYIFQPKYAPNTPEVLPQSEVVVGAARMMLTNVLPQGLRVVVTLVAWLVVMPCITSTLYRSLVFTYSPSHPFISLPATHDSGLSTSQKYSNYLYTNVVSGLLLTGLIVVTFIVLVSLCTPFRYSLPIFLCFCYWFKFRFCDCGFRRCHLATFFAATGH